MVRYYQSSKIIDLHFKQILLQNFIFIRNVRITLAVIVKFYVQSDTFDVPIEVVPTSMM